VDLTTAHREVADVLEVWWQTVQWPLAPPFAGGVWDDWPARGASGLAFCRREWEAVLAACVEESK